MTIRPRRVVHDPIRSELRRERLRLQIAELGKPYYMRPEFWTPMVPIILAVLAFASAWWTGFFDTARKDLETRVKELTAQVDVLAKERATIQAEIEKATVAYRSLLQEFTQANIQGWLTLTGTTSFLMGTRMEVCAGEYTYGNRESTGKFLMGNETAGQVVGRGIAGLHANLKKTVANYEAITLGLMLGEISQEAERQKFDRLVAEIEKRDLTYRFDPNRLNAPFFLGKWDQNAFCNEPNNLVIDAATQKVEALVAGRNAAAAALRGLIMIVNGEIDKLTLKEVASTPG